MKSDNSDTRTEKRKFGDIGENIACGFLEQRGYKVVDRNYLRKWGEIDIVARKGNLVHFVEVKSVTHGTSGYRAEDNMHPWKLKRLSRVIQTYLLDKNIDSDWQLDLITVSLNMDTRKARVELLENIVL